MDWGVVAWTAPPSIAGAVAGAFLADDVSESLLYGLIAVVLVWSGVDLALRPIKARPRERLRVARGGALAFFIGILGGAVGVILGTLRMPALIRSVGMDVRRAAGTNLVVGFLLGVSAFAVHAEETGVEWGVLARRAGGGDPGRVARRAGDRPLSRRTRFASRSACSSSSSASRSPCRRVLT